MKRLLFPIVFAFSLSACPPLPDPAPAPTPSATCADVCANMSKLGCPSAKPTAKGATCEAVCTNFQNSGIATWDLACRAAATSCAAADNCEAGR